MARKREAIAIIGEGITEKYFILSLRDILTRKPNPVKPKKSNLDELELAIKDCLKKGYTLIYCLIDKDNKLHDGNHDHRRNAEKYANLKKKYHNKRHKCPDGSKADVIMIESFPATEIFFLYYFGFTQAHYTNQQLKELLHQKFGYATEEKYLIKNSLHDTLIKAGGSIQTAIEASGRSLQLRNPEDIHCPYTEIGKMLSELME